MNPSSPGLIARIGLPDKVQMIHGARNGLVQNHLPMTDIGPNSNAMDFQQVFTRVLFQATRAWRRRLPQFAGTARMARWSPDRHERGSYLSSASKQVMESGEVRVSRGLLVPIMPRLTAISDLNE